MAPTKALFVAEPIAGELLAVLPDWARDDPDFRAVMYVYAKETAFKRERIEAVRREFFPLTADLLLPAWEATFHLAVNPPAPIADRRALVMEAFLQALATGTGVEWEESVDSFVGPGTVYQEDDPQFSSNTVPSYTVRITVPFPPGGDLYARTERMLRKIAPAHIDIILTSGEGFLLDSSQLDQEEFGGN